MDPIILVVILLLCQYPLCIFSLIQMFKLRFSRSKSIVWNVIILLLPFVGAALFWTIFGKKLRVLVKENRDKETIQSPISSSETNEAKINNNEKTQPNLEERQSSEEEKDKFDK